MIEVKFAGLAGWTGFVGDDLDAGFIGELWVG